MKSLRLLVVVAVCAIALGQTATDHDEFAFVRKTIKSSRSFVPQAGFVPDKDTAVAVAYAVAVPVYGRKQTDAEKPFRAELSNGKWVVLGTLHPAGAEGGTIIVQIDQQTGRIEYMNHSM